MYVDSSFVHMYLCHKAMYVQSLKEQFEIGWPFFKSRNIAIDYQWFPHWKYMVNLAQQIGFAQPNGKIGRKMANGRLLFQALCVGIHTVATRIETGSGQMGQPGHMFCLGQPNLGRFVKYPSFTLYWITCVINGDWT